MHRSITASAGFLLTLLVSGVAAANQPQPWQMGFQPAASPVMEQINWFHNMLLIIITLITLFVLALLVYVMWRFNEKRNPTPTKTTHNTFIEVAWTAIPVLILLLIFVPSMRVLYYSDRAADAEMTLKVVGKIGARENSASEICSSTGRSAWAWATPACRLAPPWPKPSPTWTAWWLFPAKPKRIRFARLGRKFTPKTAFATRSAPARRRVACR